MFQLEIEFLYVDDNIIGISLLIHELKGFYGIKIIIK